METNPPPSVPLPTLTGPEPPGQRRWKQMLASGIEIPSAPPGERAVNFAYSEEDVSATQKFLTSSAKVSKPHYALLAVVFIATTFFIVVRFTTHPSPHPVHQSAPQSWWAMVLPIAPAFILIAFVFVWNRIVRHNQKKLDPIIYGPRVLSLSPAGIYAEDGSGSNRTKWSFVKKIARENGYIFIVYENETANTIPTWAFVDDREAESFYNEAKQFHEAVKGKG